MTRDQLTELHYITAIENLPSIQQHGILSHTNAEPHSHRSIAMMEIQERRHNKQIPRAGRLHDYANVYFDAHNPMLSRVRNYNDEICVLRIDADILDTPGAIIADRNAASNYVGFHSVEQGLQRLNAGRIFARYWTHQDNPYEEFVHKAEKCAELLVPERIEPKFIFGAYAANGTALNAVQNIWLGLNVTTNAELFFY